MAYKKKNNSNAKLIGVIDELVHIPGTNTCIVEINKKVLVCKVEKLPPPPKQVQRLLR